MLQTDTRVEKILDVTCRRLNVARDALRSTTRTAPIVRARHIAMSAVREATHLSTPEIAVLFNRKDHTTILHAEHKVEQDENLRALRDEVLDEALVDGPRELDVVTGRLRELVVDAEDGDSAPVLLEKLLSQFRVRYNEALRAEGKSMQPNEQTPSNGAAEAAAPPSPQDAVLTAARQELLAIVGGPLDGGALTRIARLAKVTSDWLIASRVLQGPGAVFSIPNPSAGLYDTPFGTLTEVPPLAQGSSQETFGANVLRELVSLGRRRDTLGDLVEAWASAKTAGLDEDLCNRIRAVIEARVADVEESK